MIQKGAIEAEITDMIAFGWVHFGNSHSSNLLGSAKPGRHQGGTREAGKDLLDRLGGAREPGKD